MGNPRLFDYDQVLDKLNAGEEVLAAEVSQRAKKRIVWIYWSGVDQDEPDLVGFARNQKIAIGDFYSKLESTPDRAPRKIRTTLYKEHTLTLDDYTFAITSTQLEDVLIK